MFKPGRSQHLNQLKSNDRYQQRSEHANQPQLHVGNLQPRHEGSQGQGQSQYDESCDDSLPAYPTVNHCPPHQPRQQGVAHPAGCDTNRTAPYHQTHQQKQQAYSCPPYPSAPYHQGLTQELTGYQASSSSSPSRYPPQQTQAMTVRPISPHPEISALSVPPVADHVGVMNSPTPQAYPPAHSIPDGSTVINYSSVYDTHQYQHPQSQPTGSQTPAGVGYSTDYPPHHDYGDAQIDIPHAPSPSTHPKTNVPFAPPLSEADAIPPTTSKKHRMCSCGWWYQNLEKVLGITVGLLIVLGMISCMLEFGVLGLRNKTVFVPVVTNYSSQAQAALAQLLTFYDSEGGKFQKAGWWNNANCIESIIDFSAITGSADYYGVIDNTFERNKQGNFLNMYFDDQGWWAVSWAKAYILTNQQKYLDMSKKLFDNMQTGWDDSTCNGGLYWRKNNPYKSTISLLLYMQAGMLLYTHVKDDMYLIRAQTALRWLNETELLTKDGKVFDGIDGQCHHEYTLFSYNQGVLLGTLIQMYKVTGQDSYLRIAEKVADVPINDMSPNGILREGCEPKTCNYDSEQFKGVYMRYLYQLYRALTDARGVYTSNRREAYKEYIARQADSIWNNARNVATNQIGVSWSGPRPTGGDSVVQAAGLDALNAHLAIQLHG
eukprot:jgi/Chrzof1/6854/Cz02g01010.t1